MATDERTFESTVTLGPKDNGRAVTSAEFATAEFLEPWVYEREQGRLLVMSPDGQRHVDGAEPWCIQLYLYRAAHHDVVDYVVPNAWVRPDDATDRIGDIGVYLKANQPVAPIPDRVPDLMFEIVSPGRKSRERDYVTKRSDYQKLGIREYVIVDGTKRQVTVLSLFENHYQERVLQPGDLYTSNLLPGLEIPIEDVFS